MGFGERQYLLIFGLTIAGAGCAQEIEDSARNESVAIGISEGEPRLSGESGFGETIQAPVQIGNAWGTYTFAGTTDWDDDGHQDIVARDGVGDLYLYRGQSVRGYSRAGRVKIGHGWNVHSFFGTTDWDRDGHQDVISRHNGTGKLYLYPGRSVRGYSAVPPVVIGDAWVGRSFWGTTDWDKDGHQDLLSRDDATGELWLYPGRSTRGYSGLSPVLLGAGWSSFTFVGIVDWNEDGYQDIISRDDATGELFIYLGRSFQGSISALPELIGYNWAGYTFVGITDWDFDGYDDLITRRDSNGNLYLYP